MIEIKSLTKRYGDKTVYENFNLSIAEGSTVAILGASGSGKTTLLNVIAGLTPFEGIVPQLKCSYIFQTPRLVPNLTIKGNLKLICKDEKKVDEMIETAGLKDRAASYPLRLSGGEKQRVAIARAFLFGGDVMLMDEPFSSLDLKIKRQMFSLFFKIREQNPITVLTVTHDVDDAVELADRSIVISKGKIIFDSEQYFKFSSPKKEELRAAIVDALMQ